MLQQCKKLRKGKKKGKDKEKEVKPRKKANSVGSVILMNEPGTIKEMVALEEYNLNNGYEQLIEKMREDNEKMNLYSVRCNSPCNPGDVILDKSKNDEIVRMNGKKLVLDDEEGVLPEEQCQRIDLVIRRRGRAMAVPFIRQNNINLDMEYGYYYFVVNVPRISNYPIGMEFHNTPDDGVIVQNVIKNTIAYNLFSQGDYILDINGTPVYNAQEVFKMILEDETTFPRFSCVVKRACSRQTQLKVIKTLFDSHTLSLTDDTINIIESEENKILSNDGKKKKTRTILKSNKPQQDSKPETINNRCVSPTNLPKKNERSKYYCLSLRSTRSKIISNRVKFNDNPKTKEIESDIENIIFTNPVPKKSSPLE